MDSNEPKLLRTTVSDPMGHEIPVIIRYSPGQDGPIIKDVMQWNGKTQEYEDVTPLIRRDDKGEMGVAWLGKACRYQAVLDYEATKIVNGKR
jgi:hypothetical protein